MPEFHDKQPRRVRVSVEQLKEELYTELLHYVRTKLSEEGIIGPYKFDIELLVTLEYYPERK